MTIVQFLYAFISVSCKTNIGTNYFNDKKKSVLDTTPAVLLERFITFDDNKNNNRESINMLKEHHQVAKSNLENDNLTKNLEHAVFKSGNFANYKYDIYVYICPIISSL